MLHDGGRARFQTSWNVVLLPYRIMKMNMSDMFKCFDSTAPDCDAFFYFEFGATELNSTFETTPISCYCRATAELNALEFDTAVARRLRRALKSVKLSSGLKTNDSSQSREIAQTYICWGRGGGGASSCPRLHTNVSKVSRLCGSTLLSW